METDMTGAVIQKIIVKNILHYVVKPVETRKNDKTLISLAYSC